MPSVRLSVRLSPFGGAGSNGHQPGRGRPGGHKNTKLNPMFRGMTPMKSGLIN